MSLRDKYIINKRFYGYFMRHKLDTINACNKNYPLLGFSILGICLSLHRKPYSTNGKLMKRPIRTGQMELANIHRARENFSTNSTLYRPLIPAQGGVPGPVYSQHLMLINNTKRVIFPRKASMVDLEEKHTH